MKKCLAVLAMPMMLVMANTGHAGESRLEFSATAIQQAPGQQARQAKMYVSPRYVRMEYEKQGEYTVEITDLTTGRLLLLLPNKKTFAVRDAPANVIEQMQQAKDKVNPCARQPDAKCRKLGEEAVFGRTTEKWEMSVEYQGKAYTSLYWIDGQRHMPLRQQWADGTVVELKPVAEVELDGRPAEKWEMTTRRPDGNSITSSQWLDEELQMIVREEIPGGYLRELRDIKVEKLDARLFGLPSGYKQMEEAAATPPTGGNQPAERMHR